MSELRHRKAPDGEGDTEQRERATAGDGAREDTVSMPPHSRVEVLGGTEHPGSEQENVMEILAQQRAQQLQQHQEYQHWQQQQWSREQMERAQQRQHEQHEQQRRVQYEKDISDFILLVIMFLLGAVAISGFAFAYHHGLSPSDFFKGVSDFFFRKATGHRRASWGRKVQTMRVDVEVPLETLYTGGDVQIKYARQEICDVCHGTGAKHSQRCAHCGGKGAQLMQTPFGMMQVECPYCGGAGHKVTEHCSKCRGRGVYQKTVVKNIHIEPGMCDKDTVVLEEEGNQMQEADTGDMEVVVTSKRHHLYHRGAAGNSSDSREADLHTTIDISLLEAVNGFEKSIRHVRGSPVVVKNQTEITACNSVLKLPNMGLPVRATAGFFGSKGNYGDLYVTVKVLMPPTLTDKQRGAIKDILMGPSQGQNVPS